MNLLAFADAKALLTHRLRVAARFADVRRRANVFSESDDPGALRRIYVINLDRKPTRWQRQRRELNRFRDRHGKRLSGLTRRFSAIDARYLNGDFDESTLVPSFSLAEQLTVDPDPRVRVDEATRAHKIVMTPQEVAVALSHIEVWKLIAYGDVSSALILEDDVVFVRGFAKKLKAAWDELLDASSNEMRFDLLYLAYRELRPTAYRNSNRRRPIRRTGPGLWEASGYVLTRAGARRLLDRLPAHGPIDLWLNLQFDSLLVYSAAGRIIEQRLDEPSTNSYSVLPALAKLGLLTREKPLVYAAAKLPEPVIALGPYGSGLTALATALSMLGYTCLSDVDALPRREQDALERNRRRGFNAYVNIETLASQDFVVLAATYPSALFISTTSDSQFGAIHDHRHLHLEPHHRDKWAALTHFLGVEYPSLPYPDDVDMDRRVAVQSPKRATTLNQVHPLRADVSPWILRDADDVLYGFHTLDDRNKLPHMTVNWTSESALSPDDWALRDDTFPSNLALFSASNFEQSLGSPAALRLRREQTAVREYTSGAIASRQYFMHGTFGANLRSSNVSGLITGLFLHRNGPRQEIDIEFLGKDTTKMLINVYYNPGPTGARMEYGYRGTPVLVDLGFDSAADFHRYEIDWYPDVIRWKVDGEVVHERTQWNPTPIPDRPLELNLNLWYSRSEALAGRLDASQLPAAVEFRSVTVRTPAIR
jgi:GR25 family glycosyltransferase involved in LPS biosynthesis